MSKGRKRVWLFFGFVGGLAGSALSFYYAAIPPTLPILNYLALALLGVAFICLFALAASLTGLWPIDPTTTESDDQDDEREAA